MLIVLTWLALMISVIGEFTYGTSVDAAQAANARDELRAHYLARSSVSLSRLLIKIQQQFIDPVMGQVQKMLTSAMGSSSTSGTGGASIVPPPASGHRYARPGSDTRTISLGICAIRVAIRPDPSLPSCREAPAPSLTTDSPRAGMETTFRDDDDRARPCPGGRRCWTGGR